MFWTTDPNTEPSSQTIVPNVQFTPTAEFSTFPADPIYTRVKKDAFHAFHMIEGPKAHGTRRAFFVRMRDIFFQWDPEVFKTVAQRCKEVLKVPIEVMIRRKFDWVTKWVPRRIPPPSILAKPLEQLFNEFGHLVDAKTQKTLFNEAAWKSAKPVVELAKSGCLTDVPDVAMYEKAGIDKNGFQKYRCLRGANKVEGGPHADIYRKFAPFQCEFLHFRRSAVPLTYLVSSSTFQHIADHSSTCQVVRTLP